MDLKRLVGTAIGDYQLKRVLGQGGMGAVFLAWHQHMHLPYAVKVLRPDMAGNERFLERFFLEARLGAQLKHDNIVTIHYAGLAEINGVKLPYLAMEFVEGESVRSAVKQAGGRLDPLHSANVIRQSLVGLGFAHNHQMIHRDIKPDNLMITTKGVVKIADFGLARIKGETSGLTLSGQVLGTPAYMSLEQWRSDEEIDGRTDIFSLGATWYHILAGQPAYSGDPYTILAKLNAGPPQPIRELNPECDEKLAQIIATMMAVHADERYSTAQQVISEIDAWSGHVASPQVVEESLILLQPDPSRMLPTGPDEPHTEPAHTSPQGGSVGGTLLELGPSSSASTPPSVELSPDSGPVPTTAPHPPQPTHAPTTPAAAVAPRTVDLPSPVAESGAMGAPDGSGSGNRTLLIVLVALVMIGAGVTGALIGIAGQTDPEANGTGDATADTGTPGNDKAGRNTNADAGNGNGNGNAGTGNSSGGNASNSDAPPDPTPERGKAAFERASARNTPEGWRVFLAEYGDTSFADAARDQLLALDDADATRARDAATAAAWNTYLERFSDGRHVEEAGDHLAFFAARDAIRESRASFSDMQAAARGYRLAYPAGQHTGELTEIIRAADETYADSLVTGSLDEGALADYLAESDRPHAARVRAALGTLHLESARATLASGDADAIRAAWQRYLDAIPDGDHTAEATLRVRFPVPDDERPAASSGISPRRDGTGYFATLIKPGLPPINLRWVPAGFVCLDEDRQLYATHRGFWLGTTEVTVAEWMAYLRRQNRDLGEWKDVPYEERRRSVVRVSYEDARAMCRYLGGDLPSEVMWLAAARGYAEVTPRPFPWGTDKHPVADVWLTGDAPVEVQRQVTASDVGPFGHVALGGNVREWCLDGWSATTGGLPADVHNRAVDEPVAAEAGKWLARGGSFRSGSIDGARLTARHRVESAAGADDLGFRICIPVR